MLTTVQGDKYPDPQLFGKGMVLKPKVRLPWAIYLPYQVVKGLVLGVWWVLYFGLYRFGHPSRLHIRLLAEHFGVSAADLGLTRQKILPLTHDGDLVGSVATVLAQDPTGESEPRVIESQQEWLHVRKAMHRNHAKLAQAAARLYPEDCRVGTTGVLARPGWMLPTPIELSAIRIAFEANAAPPILNGSEETTRHVRPLRSDEHRYRRYSQAIRDVAQPKLFENRLSWRLLTADFTASDASLPSA